MKPLLATEAVIRDGMWRGEPCCVIGGGPSFLAVDKDLVLSKCRTIGCNVAAKLRPDIVYAVDEKCIALIEEHGWVKSDLRFVWNGVVDRLGGRLKNPWYTLPRIRGNTWAESLWTGIGNIGACGVHAYNIAACLGADPIYLLGFDCDFKMEKSTEKDRHHWHSDYPQNWWNCNASLRSFFAVFRERVPEAVKQRTIVLYPTKLAELGYQTITAEELERCLIRNPCTR